MYIEQAPWTKEAAKLTLTRKDKKGMKQREGQQSLREEAKKSESHFLHKQSQKAINYICGFLYTYVDGNG